MNHPTRKAVVPVGSRLSPPLISKAEDRSKLLLAEERHHPADIPGVMDRVQALSLQQDHPDRHPHKAIKACPLPVWVEAV